MKFGHAGQDLYDGSNLTANQDVVVVTINYRTNGRRYITSSTDSAKP